MNATFNVTLSTPIGTKKGVVTFLDKNGVLSGSIRAMGRSNYFKNGKIIGNSFEFSGILNAGFFNFRYTAKGIIDGDTLNAIATTNSGTFQIIGTRTS
nr:hypothetical protein [uncultured Caproiciproducens sp.]